MMAAALLRKLAILLCVCDCVQDRGSYDIVRSLVEGDTIFG